MAVTVILATALCWTQAPGTLTWMKNCFMQISCCPRAVVLKWGGLAPQGTHGNALWRHFWVLLWESTGAAPGIPWVQARMQCTEPLSTAKHWITRPNVSRAEVERPWQTAPPHSQPAGKTTTHKNNPPNARARILGLNVPTSPAHLSLSPSQVCSS